MHIGIATLIRDKTWGDYVASLLPLIASIKGTYSYMLNRTSSAEEGRDKQLYEAYDRDLDFLLMIDADTVFPETDSLQKLINLDKDVATGIYYERTYPFRPVIHEFTEDFTIKNLASWPKVPFKVDSCGAGFLLISRKVIKYFVEKKIKPFEVMLNGINEIARDDTAFCIRCYQTGLEIWADPSIRLGHIRKDIVWPEYFQAAKNTIEGSTHVQVEQLWTTNEEINWLTNTASSMDTALEVGAWKGRSAKALLEGCKGIVYSVDHFLGSVGAEVSKENESVFIQYARNVKEYNNLVIIKMASHEAAKLFADNSIDMVFIDAGHSYEEVIQDIELWYPKVKKIICGHDYANFWPGVIQAVNEKFSNRFKIIETIWSVNKDS